MSSKASAPGHFGQRLQQALDRTAIPPGRRRTTALANHYAIARETARLWLAGRAMPELPRLIEIADDCKVSLDWLATGRGPMIVPFVGEEAGSYEILSPEEQKVLKAVRKLSSKRRQGLLAMLDTRD
ncbi:DNA-binding protein [Frateuria sp. Soil773]|uniref:helix-turn-helix domain-containing protein n=1 Tax=Frateuria sp. Soil773 TaxID=1736407 RepID=UPI0006FDF7E4|nr:helix-turn-helix domain-containing protein [Frateuria sp. Soil773]KRF02162.1 DNA-binding protein [Frateuria sp. Soil773]